MGQLDAILIMVAVPLVLVGSYVARYFKLDARLERALRAEGSVPIDSLKAKQIAKVSGRIREFEELIEGPLTGRACVFYWVLVEEGARNHWRTVVNDFQAVDFLLEDESGVARVTPDGAKALLVMDAHFRSKTFKDATPELEAYLSRFGERSTNLLGFNRSIRYREAVLELDEEVAVLGAVRMERDPDPTRTKGGYRSRPERPVLHSPEGASLLVSDDPKVVDIARRN